MQARCLPARHGALWLLGGFRLFRRNPPLLTALTLTYLMIVQLAVHLLPAVGPFVLPLVLPALTIMVANGARVAESGRPVNADALLFGVKGKGVPLLRLGGLHLLGAFSLVGVMLLLEGGGVQFGDLEKGDDAEVLRALFMVLLLATPLLMGFMFAPYLTGWDGVAPLKSIFFSFVASARNWRALTGYGLAVGIVAVGLPGLLMALAGLLDKTLADAAFVVLRMALMFVMAPVVVASLYVGYSDIFHGAAEEPAPARIDEQA